MKSDLRGWVVLIAAVLMTPIIMRFASEAMLIAIACGPIATLLATNEAPQQPIWKKNWRDR